MKILLDPIYTTHPSRCASNVKMRRIAEYLMEQYDDLYVYWLVPENMPEEEWDWFPESGRIKYIPMPMDYDRYKMYTRLPYALEKLIAFDGSHFDWDVLVTNKTSLVSLYRMLMIKPGQLRAVWSKKIVLLEDMPLMHFKGTVAVPPGDAPEQQTIMGYLNSDVTAISAFWEKDKILESAKKHFAPSTVRKVRDNIVEATPALIENVEFKSKETVQRTINREKPFTISFSGRLVLSSRLEELWDIMTRHWVMRSNDEHKIRCMMTTASRGMGRGAPPDLVEIVPAPRDEFWRIVKEEADVGIYLSSEDDYSMSVIEPLSLGLPIALYKCDWSVASVGEEYPFFVKNMKEAYSVVRAFYDDYATMYKKFVDWSKEYFEPLLQSRNSDYVPYVVQRTLQQWRDELPDFYYEESAEGQQLGTNILQRITHEPQTIFEICNQMQSELGMDSLDRKANPDQRDEMRQAYSTNWNRYRLIALKEGAIDAGVEPGTLRWPDE